MSFFTDQKGNLFLGVPITQEAKNELESSLKSYEDLLLQQAKSIAISRGRKDITEEDVNLASAQIEKCANTVWDSLTKAFAKVFSIARKK